MPNKSSQSLSVEERERLKAARLERLPRVVDSYLKGRSIREIADSTNVSTHVIYRDLALAKKQWMKKVEHAADELLNEELAKINLVERNAWEAWEESRKDAVETTEDTDEKGNTRKGKKRRGQYGDARFLQVAMNCIDKRCKMLKIGEYSNDDPIAQQAKTVEIVVDSPEQIDSFDRMMDFDEFQKLSAPSEN